MTKKPGKQDQHGHNFVIFIQVLPLDRHISLVHITVNGQALAVYLKMFKIFLSMIHLRNAFSWFSILSECQMPVNKWLYEEWKVCT